MVEKTINRIKALSDQGRLRVMSLIEKGKEVQVNIIENVLGLPQSTVSRHLSFLKNSGWLSSRREGKSIYYKLADDDKSGWYWVLQVVLKELRESPQFRNDLFKLG
jgi:ArsR family transcriptional regulator